MPRPRANTLRIAGLLVAIIVLGNHIGESSARAAGLRAGVAAVNITVDKPTTIVHDPLLAKALVLDDGRTRAVVVALDLGGASASTVAKLRAMLREELKIEEANVLVGASHNHHTQGQVAKDLLQRTVEAVRRALAGMVPVRIGAGAGREDRITMNRRLRLKDGKEWTIRRANPSPPDRDVVAVGPLDPEIGILRLDRMDGRVLAVLYNFAGHPYGGVPNGGVTADLPGFASRVLEQSFDGAVALFLQGAAGDVTPIRYKDVDSPPPTERLGTMLGLSTLAAVKKIGTEPEGTLRMVSRTVKLPRRTDIDERIKTLEAEQEKILHFFDGKGCGTHGAGTFLNFKTFLPLYTKRLIDPDRPAGPSYWYEQEKLTGQTGLEELDAQNQQRVDKYLAAIANMERLIQVRANLGSMRRHKQRGLTEPIEADIQGLRVGQFVLVTFPGEPFAEVGLRIKKQSPFPQTFLAGYANGHLGYAPTADAYRSQAYEDCLSPFAPQWQAIFEAAALEVIGELRGTRD